MNSLFNADNLVEEDQYPITPLSYFETKDKEFLKFALTNLVKPDPVPPPAPPSVDKRV